MRQPRRFDRVGHVPGCEQPSGRLQKDAVGLECHWNELLTARVGALAEEGHGVLVSKAETSSCRSDGDVTAPDPIRTRPLS